MRKAARVAVEKTAYHFDREFDYRIPDLLTERAVPGCRVMVPFGTSNTKRLGLILGLVDEEETKELKPLAAVLDQAPLLSDEGIRLVFWLKQRYFCTLFEAAKLLLPAGIQFRLRTGYRCAPDRHGSGSTSAQTSPQCSGARACGTARQKAAVALRSASFSGRDGGERAD